MLNRPWIDPSAVDWTDALNPLAKPGFSQNNNPYAFAALSDPLMQAIRLAAGIEPRLYVAPDDFGREVPAGQTVDFEAPIDPNTWLWGINASSLTGDDFLFNVADTGTGATLFSQPAPMSVYNAALAGTGGRGPIHLVKPHLFMPPGYAVVRIINTSGDPLRCWVNLFCVVEIAK